MLNTHELRLSFIIYHAVVCLPCLSIIYVKPLEQITCVFNQIKKSLRHFCNTLGALSSFIAHWAIKCDFVYTAA